MTIKEIPEFRVTSEISICQNSFCDDIPERFINVDIQIIHHNDFLNNSLSKTKKGMKNTKRKYVYLSTTLEKSKWPKLKISSSYIRESRFFTNDNENQKEKGNKIQIDSNLIKLSTSLTQSLQKISKEEEQKYANKSPRTRPLRAPCFSSYASADRNIVIPISEVPYKDLPHPFKSKTQKIPQAYTNQKMDQNDPFIKFNGYNTNSPYFLNSNNYTNSGLYSSSTYNPSKMDTQNIQKKKSVRKSDSQTSKETPKSNTAKTQKISSTPTLISNTTLGMTSPYFDDEEAHEMNQQTVPLIFRTEMRKKKKNGSLEKRPYFTTCQEPLTKRPSTYNEMRSSLSHII